MASKGSKESDRSRKAKTSKAKPRRSQAAGAGGSGVEQSSEVTPKSWTFAIVRPTPVAARCKAGEGAQGIQSGKAVAVNTDQGTIGFAPAEESADMLGALRQSPGATLVGQVDAAGDGKTSPRVTLTLKRGG